jgi:hypothetical protein
MQPVTITYAWELAVGLITVIAISGFLIATMISLLIASNGWDAKPSRKALKGTHQPSNRRNRPAMK